MALFEYGKSTKDYQYYFQLRDDNNQILLSSSEGYPDEKGCLAGIEAVKIKAGDETSYELYVGPDNLYYFLLREDNQQVFGISEGYNASFNRDRGMEHCMQIAPNAGIRKIVPFSKIKLTEF